MQLYVVPDPKRIESVVVELPAFADISTTVHPVAVMGQWHMSHKLSLRDSREYLTVLSVLSVDHKDIVAIKQAGREV